MLPLATGEGENRKLMMSPHFQNVEAPISSISQPSIVELHVQNQKESSSSLPPSTNPRTFQLASGQESKVQAPPVRSDLGEVQRSGVPSGPNGGSPSENHHFGLSYPLIALVCGGLVLFVITTCTVAFWCAKKKNKQKKQPAHNMQYYADTSGTDYYIDGASPKWGSQESIDPSGGNWFQPPQLMTTTEMSTGFSGPHAPPLPPPSPARALGYNKSTFTFDELSAATNGFAEANLLGQGGFGYVHKGVLPTGKEIAVKSLKAGSGQGEREFQAEVDIISRVHHRHLVSLVGYCIAAEKRLLIYDFLPNKTLEYHLHGKSPPIDWSTRLKIALGSAKGLAYLHEDCHPRIIHRDIKAANILLDLKFEALVADFGLAKLSSDNHTHISTRVMGTFGYLAPEYASSGKLTEKSDVFSYGVMLLELITGRRPCESSHTFMDDSLVDWARPILSRSLSNGNYDELVDQRLNGNYDPMEMARMVACAAAAVRHSARRRPKMSQIVRALDGDILLEDLNEGMRPGQSMLFGSGSDFENDIYTPAMRRTMRKLPVASPDYSDDFSDSMGNFVHRRANSASSDGVFSNEMSPIGIPRHKGRSPF